LDPLHYALEGLVVTQFHRDDTPVTLLSGVRTTAEKFIEQYYEKWSYDHWGFDVLALFLFIIALRYARARLSPRLS